VKREIKLGHTKVKPRQVKIANGRNILKNDYFFKISDYFLKKAITIRRNPLELA
jgi:hypothetical protein